MVFSWFNTSKVEDQLAKSHDLLPRHARDFVQREKPNLYQKARIASRMKWALEQALHAAAQAAGR